MLQSKRSCPGVPHRYTPTGELWVGREIIVVDPAFSVGSRRVDKLRSVDDPERGSTNEATFAKTPIYLPSRGHISQVCTLFDRNKELRPLALATADHADACKQLPRRRAGGLASVVTHRNPTD